MKEPNVVRHPPLCSLSYEGHLTRRPVARVGGERRGRQRDRVSVPVALAFVRSGVAGPRRAGRRGREQRLHPVHQLRERLDARERMSVPAISVRAVLHARVGKGRGIVRGRA